MIFYFDKDRSHREHIKRGCCRQPPMMAISAFVTIGTAYHSPHIVTPNGIFCRHLRWVFIKYFPGNTIRTSGLGQAVTHLHIYRSIGNTQSQKLGTRQIIWLQNNVFLSCPVSSRGLILYLSTPMLVYALDVDLVLVHLLLVFAAFKASYICRNKNYIYIMIAFFFLH